MTFGPIAGTSSATILETHDTSDWEYKDATLVRQLDNGTVIQSEDEGLLYATIVRKNTKEERRGTVCDDDFDIHAARILCHNMGYQIKTGDWGSSPSYKYISK